MNHITNLPGIPNDSQKTHHALDEIKPSLERGHTSVVLIDDNRIGAEQIAEFLRSAGLDISVVNDPAKAVEVVERVLPDLILFDLHMPGLDGIELAAVIQFLLPVHSHSNHVSVGRGQRCETERGMAGRRRELHPKADRPQAADRVGQEVFTPRRVSPHPVFCHLFPGTKGMRERHSS